MLSTPKNQRFCISGLKKCNTRFSSITTFKLFQPKPMVRKGRSGPNETFACSDARGGCFRFEQTQGEYCAGLGDAPTSRHRASQSRLIVHAIDYFFEAYQQNLKIGMRSNFKGIFYLALRRDWTVFCHFHGDSRALACWRALLCFYSPLFYNVNRSSAWL